MSIRKCNVNGQINASSCGGILGNDCNGYSSNFTSDSVLKIQKCISTMDITISGTNSGCIIAPGFGSQSAGVYGLIDECYSTGILQAYGCGGIVGQSCSYYNIQNCYSTGTIYKDANGLIGYSVGSNCTITDSYSRGHILEGGFGIAGGGQALTSVTNCYARNQYVSLIGVKNLKKLRGSFGGFSHNIWEKHKHAYPTLKA